MLQEIDFEREREREEEISNIHIFEIIMYVGDRFSDRDSKYRVSESNKNKHCIISRLASKYT